MSRERIVGLVSLGVIVTAGCNQSEFRSPLVLGGREVSAEVLNRGLLDYRRYCVGCHGLRGDGQGQSAGSMRPPPRDFTKGAFKFTGVPGGALPSDADIVRTLRHGLKGTHMPAFGVLPEEDVGALVQYIKTFSPRWRTETPGQEVPIPRDPWDSGHRTEGVKRGELVYHAVAQCWSCHPAYSRKDEIGSMVRAEWERAGKTPPRSVPFRSEIGRPKAVTSVYGKILPPDFLDDTLRSCEEKADLYRTVAAGVGGTPMPSWFKELPAVDLWAVVHYVEELTRIKGTPEGEVLRKRLRP